MKSCVTVLFLFALGCTPAWAQSTNPPGDTRPANPGAVRTRSGQTFEGDVHIDEGQLVEVASNGASLMKLLLSDVALLRLSSSATNRLAVLSINFQGGGKAMEPSEVAGVVRATHWNNFTKKKNSAELMDSEGRPSGVTHHFTGRNFDDRTNSIPDVPGDFRMMRGTYDQTDGMTHRIADIPFARYDVYVYFDRADDENCRTFNHKFWITGAGGGDVLAGPVFGQDRFRTNFDGQFIEVPLSSTNDNSGTLAGNFFHFTNLTASTINVMVGDGASSWGEREFSRSCINGLQIVGTAPASAAALTHGIVLRNGNTVAGAVRSADENTVRFITDHGTEATVSTRQVARLIFAPMFADVERSIPSGRTGALLRGGDFMEGEFQSVNAGKLRMTSVLFGTRSFDIGHEVVALILAPAQTAGGAFRVTMRDGGVLTVETVQFGKDEVHLNIPNLGVLRFPFRAVKEIERAAKAPQP